MRQRRSTRLLLVLLHVSAPFSSPPFPTSGSPQSAPAAASPEVGRPYWLQDRVSGLCVSEGGLTACHEGNAFRFRSGKGGSGERAEAGLTLELWDPSPPEPPPPPEPPSPPSLNPLASLFELSSPPPPALPDDAASCLSLSHFSPTRLSLSRCPSPNKWSLHPVPPYANMFYGPSCVPAPGAFDARWGDAEGCAEVQFLRVSFPSAPAPAPPEAAPTPFPRAPLHPPSRPPLSTLSTLLSPASVFHHHPLAASPPSAAVLPPPSTPPLSLHTSISSFRNPYLSPDAVHADPATGLTVPAHRSHGREQQVLVGAGVYAKTVFKVKVYLISLYVAPQQAAADPTLRAFANRNAAALSSDHAFLPAVLSPSASFDMTISLTLNMQLSTDTMRGSLAGDWSLLTPPMKAALSSSSLRASPASPGMVDSLREEGGGCSCGQVVPGDVEADQKCCGRGTTLDFTYVRSNHPAPHTLEVRLNGLLMETFSADYAHAIFYESRRIAERRDAVNRWKRAISIVSGRAAPQPAAQGRPAEVGGVEGGGSEGAAAEAGLGEGGVEGGGAEGAEANNSPILAVLVHAYLILLLIVSLPSNNHVVRKGGRKGGGARAGGARGRKALETKLESIGESGSVDSWHDGYAAAVKAEGAGLRKSISFYL
ncbi:hypothetical protein TeGR_g116 [Tetraparma gracilis]|uniref:Uncharacterized protein n=1 Tax=Tetraparma gracilis TaxID=2962635 RepID=A0ABQ6MH68_9STRA|nr:hypothetical protein TeGR_g116 [Tetraparma gracilis]